MKAFASSEELKANYNLVLLVGAACTVRGWGVSPGVGGEEVGSLTGTERSEGVLSFSQGCLGEEVILGLKRRPQQDTSFKP